MWNPLKSLQEKFTIWLDSLFAEFDNAASSPRPAQAPPTPFEKQLLDRFSACKKTGGYRALFVSIELDENGPYFYQDKAGVIRRAGYIIGALASNRSYDYLLQEEKNIHRKIVMLLDPNGPAIENQIPGWQTGQIRFPASYIQNPLIAVTDAAGLLEASPHDDGIVIAGTAARTQRYASYAGTDMSGSTLTPPVPLPPEGFKLAVALSEAGRRYPVRRHIVRGVLVNDDVKPTPPRANLS